MKRPLKIFLIILAMVISGLLLILLPPFFSTIRPAVAIDQKHYDSLLVLRDLAAQSGEYPVSALVTYKDSIIGSGFNTFRNFNEPLGHAEINAICKVFEGIHYSDFRALSRDSLVMICYYEPCPMCKGVINHLDIRKIYYVQPKNPVLRFKYERKELTYHLKTRRIKAPQDQ